MREQVVSTGGRATRAIVRVQDKRIVESPEEKAVNPRGSSCAFHCESRAYNLARFMANPSSGEPASGATCVAGVRHEIYRSRDRMVITNITPERRKRDTVNTSNTGLIPFVDTFGI
jgi:hypothetical protein